ncbi:unnamed protein product [Prunus armeniaca]|uniref:Uncharacterized protein n=1 Tax=Prunus armeniaca TaxID=36596 RepID=A0A6J5V3Z5_PRUAR|nr:unnamed protein product [Prunus armeniaca]CAB4312899.1 unnamed protein product [Prunus armeniaca]
MCMHSAYGRQRRQKGKQRNKRGMVAVVGDEPERLRGTTTAGRAIKGFKALFKSKAYGSEIQDPLCYGCSFC